MITNRGLIANFEPEEISIINNFLKVLYCIDEVLDEEDCTVLENTVTGEFITQEDLNHLRGTVRNLLEIVDNPVSVKNLEKWRG